MKITKTENIRVVVRPKDSLSVMLMSECERIKNEINRHVDDVGCCEVEYEVSEECSLCGYGWEEIDGIPQCCDEAVEEYKANKEDGKGENEYK